MSVPPPSVHLRSVSPVAVPEDLVPTVASVLGENVQMSRAAPDTIVIATPDVDAPLLIIAGLSPDGTTPALLEVVGPHLAAGLAATMLLGEHGYFEIEPVGDAAWDARAQVEVPEMAVISVPEAALIYSPWIRAMHTTAERDGMRVVLRTPAQTRISAGMRRLLRERWAVWVREEAEGPVDGISGVPLQWTPEGALDLDERPAGTPDRDAHGLQITVERGYDDAATGDLLERVLRAVAGDAVLPTLRRGLTEPPVEDWDQGAVLELAKAASPDPLTVFVSGEGVAGTVAFLPTPTGLVEQVDIDLAAAPDVDAAWGAVAELLPRSFTLTDHGPLVEAIYATSALDGLDGFDGKTAPLAGGYVTLLAPGEDGAERPISTRLPGTS